MTYCLVLTGCRERISMVYRPRVQANTFTGNEEKPSSDGKNRCQFTINIFYYSTSVTWQQVSGVVSFLLISKLKLPSRRPKMREVGLRFRASGNACYHGCHGCWSIDELSNLCIQTFIHSFVGWLICWLVHLRDGVVSGWLTLPSACAYV